MSIEPFAASPATVRRPAQSTSLASWSAATLAVVAASSTPALADRWPPRSADNPSTFLVGQPTPVGSSASDPPASSLAETRAELDRELDLARRMGDALRSEGDLGASLAGMHSAQIAALHGAMRVGPGDSPAERATTIARALRGLRSRLVEEIPSFSLWLSVMKAIYPDAERIEVPARFVVRDDAPPHDDALMDDLAAAALAGTLAG